MRCSKKKANGAKCKTPALRGTELCIWHSGRAAEIGRRGGLRRTVFNPENLKHFEPATNPGDLLAVVTQTLVDAREARLDCKTANVIGNLAAVALQLMRSTNLEGRILALEEKKRRGEHYV